MEREMKKFLAVLDGQYSRIEIIDFDYKSDHLYDTLQEAKIDLIDRLNKKIKQLEKIKGVIKTTKEDDIITSSIVNPDKP